jgi:hypothetical protein
MGFDSLEDGLVQPSDLYRCLCIHASGKYHVRIFPAAQAQMAHKIAHNNASSLIVSAQTNIVKQIVEPEDPLHPVVGNQR